MAAISGYLRRLEHEDMENDLGDPRELTELSERIVKWHEQSQQNWTELTAR